MKKVLFALMALCLLAGCAAPAATPSTPSLLICRLGWAGGGGQGDFEKELIHSQGSGTCFGPGSRKTLNGGD